MEELVEIYPWSDMLMRDNVTGETKWVRWNYSWYDHSRWFWREGNFCCDCNRGSLFDGNNDVEYKCSHYTGNRFTVLKAKFPDDSEIEIDGV